jgi:hypothetical protein
MDEEIGDWEIRAYRNDDSLDVKFAAGWGFGQVCSTPSVSRQVINGAARKSNLRAPGFSGRMPYQSS